MGRKGLLFVCFCVVYLALCSQNEALPQPRDVVILKGDKDIRNIYDESTEVGKQQSEYHVNSFEPTRKVPGRVWCEYEEATEDLKCQEHCLPKGYSYGLCVHNTCSCI